MSGADKGKFSTEIAQDVIDQAVRSVERHSGAPSAPPADGFEVEVPTEEIATAEATDPGEVSELKAQLELSQAKGRELMEKLKETHDRMLRAVADLENFRKRAQKEKEEVQKFGNERLLKDLLPVLDNLDRALDHSKSHADPAGLEQGVAMTRKLFEDALGKHGVKAFSGMGKPFDPNFHEAMQQVEKSDVPPNQVVGEVLRGFTLNERLMRPALVMVSKAPPAPAEPKAAEGETKDGAP